MSRLTLVLVLVLALTASTYGELVSSRSQSLINEPLSIAAADFDCNRVPDTAIIGTLTSAKAIGASVSWDMSIKAGARVPVAAADLDGKGCLNYAIVGGDNLYAVNYAGSLVWGINDTKTYSIAAGDINRDGRADIVVGGFNSIRAFDNAGRSLWNYTNLDGQVNHIAMLDGVIAAAYKNLVIMLDYSGNLLSTTTLLGITEGSAPYVAAMAAFDLDGIGTLNGVATAYIDGDYLKVTAISKYGEDKKWTFRIYNNYCEGPCPVGNIAGVDKNSKGKLDHVAVSTPDGVYWITNLGTPFGSAKPGLYNVKTFAPIDLDGDGILDDVMIGAESDKYKGIYVFNAYGGTASNILANTTENGAVKLVAIDLTGDGKVSEAIGVDRDKYVYLLIARVTDTTTMLAPVTTTPAPTTTPPPTTTAAPTTTPPPGVTTTPPPVPGAQPTVKIVASPGASVAEGVTVTLTADAMPSPGKTIVSYIWTEDGKLLGDAKSITWNSSKKGVYKITVSVKDSGELKASDTIAISVGQPAVGKLAVSAGEDKTVEENTPVTLTATAAPSQGAKIVAYIWRLDGKEIGDSQSITLASLPKGVHKITVDVIDSAGEKGSATVTITVGGGGLLPSLSFGGIVDALLGKLKWVILLVIILGVIIYAREKILDFLWERQRQWME